MLTAGRILALVSADVSVPPFTPDGVLGVPLASGRDPERVVLIRLHAFGDTAITFPVVAAVRRRLPRARLDVVTDIRSAGLFEAHRDVDAVFSWDTRRGKYRKGLAVLRVALALRSRGARPTVVDLQRNRWSQFLTRLLVPEAWVGFDRHAPKTALTRYLDAVETIGLGRLSPVLSPHAKDELIERARKRLEDAGWKAGDPVVCLNPAGGWKTKQWPIERYTELGARLAREGCRLMSLSASPVPPRFIALRENLGEHLMDFSGRTTPAEALALASMASLVVSDDSGLMHLGWVQGVPTLALFGSSRTAWSRPEGPRTGGFYSEDLSCGACMQPTCAREDLLCLTRVTVDDVFRKSLELMRGS
jgi:ADP-heptose:LPS heptosyltransferase